MSTGKITKKIETLKIKTLEMEPLSEYTSFRVGGPAEIMVFPKTESQIKKVLDLAIEEALPITLLGKGSNILAPDEMLKGVTINLSHLNKQVKKNADTLRAGGGILNSNLLSKMLSFNVAGLEFLAGIPGTVGGSLAVNAGADGRSMGDVLLSARILSMDYPFDTRELKKKDIDFSYRTFTPSYKGVVISAVFYVFEQARAKSKEKIKELIRNRKKMQPIGLPSAGCVFKNPIEMPAGMLIDKLGFKGYVRGGAEVSRVHANFIVNNGGATSEDVKFIIGEIKDKALRRMGIELNEEIKII